MKTSPVAFGGGILILIGGLALAYYTGTEGAALEAAKARSVEKYVALTDKALAGGDLKMAEKYAKEALVVDPKNKKAIAEFKKVILASCPKAAPTPTPAAPTAAGAEAPKAAEAATPAAATPAAAPAQPKAEAEEEMGCI